MSSKNFEDIKEEENISLKDFLIVAEIGKGAYGAVYLVKKNELYFAMKAISKTIFKNEINEGLILTEKKILQNFNLDSSFPFIPRLKYSFQDENNVYLITEFYQGGELYFHLKKVGHFNETATKFYLAQIVLIIEYLHNNKIIYGDLKPENLMLGTDGYLNLCDYGLSKYDYEIEKFITEDGEIENKQINENSDKIILGTPNYLSPEQTQKINNKDSKGKEIKYTNNLSYEDDIWGIGIVFYELITGECPFTSNDKKKLYNEISNNYSNLEFPVYLSENAKNLLMGLITNKDHRLKLPQIKQHPFFKSFQWDDILNKKMKAPFIPRLKSPIDLKYFNASFSDLSKECEEDNQKEDKKDYNYIFGFFFNYEKDFKTSNGSNYSLFSQTTSNESIKGKLSTKLSSKNEGDSSSFNSLEFEKEQIY